MERNPKQDANLLKGKATQFSGENAVMMAEKSHESRKANTKRRKALKEELDYLLQQRMIDPETGKKTKTTIQTALTNALIAEALDGNTKAFEIIRDTVGEQPTQKITISETDPEIVREIESMVLGDEQE